MDRRQFLRLSSGVVVGAAATPLLAACEPGSRPFRHGVASGDPRPNRVVLWTRVTPSDDALPGSGRGPDVDVRWEVFSDAAATKLVTSGSYRTNVHVDHTVKVDVGGLQPATTYFYRFAALGGRSPVGRTKTAPAASAEVASLRFGLVSCANWEAGWFSAYRHLARRNDLDLVVHVGDYLYEYGAGSYPDTASPLRRHDPAHEIVSLADYRRRHAQYKTDPDLQLLHRNYPFACTWDDHESANDSWQWGAENHQPATEGSWGTRRWAAYRAYLEWMPVLAPRNELRLYRQLRFGRLADLWMLDLRSFRSEQVPNPADPRVADPSRTIAGDTQLAWLKDGLAASPATWKLIGNSVMAAPVLFPPLPTTVGRAVSDVVGLYPPDGQPYNVDQWDGYQADRRELVGHLQSRNVRGTVFLTGDIHSSWACDIPVDAGTYTGAPTSLSPSVGIELVCPSVTSDNLDEITGTPPRTTSTAVETGIRGLNRHIKLVEFDSHGYTVVEATPGAVQADWWFVSDRTDPQATSAFGTSYRSTAGSGSLVPAASSLPPRPSSAPLV